MIRVRLRNLTLDDVGLPKLAGASPEISIEGHADYGKKGEDIVCAGVSALAGTVIVAITRIAGIRQDVDQKEGMLRTVLYPGESSDEQRRSLEVLLGTLLLGLREMQAQYPENIDIIFE